MAIIQSVRETLSQRERQHFTGAFVGERLSVSNGSAVRYDETLAGW